MIRAGLTLLLSAQPDLEVCGECHEAAGVISLLEMHRPESHRDLHLSGEQQWLNPDQDIKKKYKSQKMLVYSMHDEGLFAARAIQAGAMGYIEKSAHPRETIEAIRKVLQGHMAVSERVTDTLMSTIAGPNGIGAGFHLDVLSSRELEVFELLGRGLTVREIAERLSRSAIRIESHRERWSWDWIPAPDLFASPLNG